jgi:colicin import membrane protein
VSESKELVLVQLPAPADLEAAFISDEYISNLIADIRQKALSVVGDVNTVKGRGVYISMASTVRRTKTAIDEAGKNLVAEMKKRPALVDASRKKVRDALDELAVEIRRPATEWEAEQERIKAEEAARVKAPEYQEPHKQQRHQC